jgi:hemolysin activation/secretion protein
MPFAQNETPEPLPAPSPEEEAPGVLPEPFSALPYEPDPEEASSSPDAAAVPDFALPPVDRYLPPRAIPVPTLRFTGIRFKGNTIFSDRELMELAGSYIGRELSQEDLDQLRYDITLRYVKEGYINSGATIPDPQPADGVLTVQVTEGRLTEVLVKGNEGLSTAYLRSRVLSGNDQPMKFSTIQRQLQVLQGNPNIARLNAELKPGLLPGEALMVVDVEETPPWSYGTDIHNQRSPSVGGEQVDLWVENRNLTGYSDLLRARLGLFSGSPGDVELAGLDNLYLDYQRPLTGADTALVLGGSTEGYSILEEPFVGLGIEGQSWSARAGFRHPVHRTINDEWWAFVILEKSHDETTLLGRPFSISPGSVDGELDLTVLRCGLEWTRRTLDSALVLRSGVSWGLDALGATRQPNEPDGSYLAFFLDAQNSRRMNKRGDVLVAHGACQFANDTLTPPAQFRIGGRYSVRGYRENYLVRDNGISAGLDYQFPITGGGEDTGWSVWLVPFADAGVGWNEGGGPSESLLSAGLGLRVNYGSWFRGEIFYGFPLTNKPQESGNLQDDGLHFRMTIARF